MTAIWTLLNVATVIPITQDHTAIEPTRTALRRDPKPLKLQAEHSKQPKSGALAAKSG